MLFHTRTKTELVWPYHNVIKGLHGLVKPSRFKIKYVKQRHNQILVFSLGQNHYNNVHLLRISVYNMVTNTEILFPVIA